jgi:hypothetical protein
MDNSLGRIVSPAVRISLMTGYPPVNSLLTEEWVMSIAAVPPAQRSAPYDGTTSFPDSEPPVTTVASRVRAGVTTVFVVVPFAGLAAAVWLAWGHGLGLAEVLLAAGFYALTGLGVTVGFHRLLTHRAFTASRPLRIALAIAGSMTFQGDVIGWVAIHRRHHAFTDRPGDPHSPYRYGTSVGAPFRGLAHAHVGWHTALGAFLWAGLAASPCCSTSPGRSIHCATSSAAAPTPPAATAAPRPCGRWR